MDENGETLLTDELGGANGPTASTNSTQSLLHDASAIEFGVGEYQQLIAHLPLSPVEHRVTAASVLLIFVALAGVVGIVIMLRSPPAELRRGASSSGGEWQPVMVNEAQQHSGGGGGASAGVAAGSGGSSYNTFADDDYEENRMLAIEAAKREWQASRLSGAGVDAPAHDAL